MGELLQAAKEGFFGAFRMAWCIVTFNFKGLSGSGSAGE